MQRWLMIALVGLATTPALVGAQAEDEAPLEDEAPEQPAEAQGPTLTPEVEAEARSRFELGESLYHQGRFEEALVEFERAYELTQRPAFYYNIYLCHRDAGNLQQAVESLRRYLRESEPDDVPNRGLLERRLTTLEAQIEAEAAAQSSEAEARRQAAEAEARAARMEVTYEAPNRTGPVLLMSLGGAAILAGAGVGISALFLHDELEQDCFGSACPYWKNDEIDALRRRTIAFDVSMSVGGALLLGGLVWFLVDGPREVPVQVSCGPVGCTLRGSF